MNGTSRLSDGRSKDERDLSRIVAFGSGMVLGAMLALSQAMRIKDATFSLQFSLWTAIVFVIGFAIGFGYLNRVLGRGEQTSRLFQRGGLIIIIILCLAAFVYPFRFGIDELTERLGGVAVAVCFIGTGLTLVRQVVRAAERNEAEREAEERSGSTNRIPPETF